MRRMALGRDRALGARLAVCAVRERIAVWHWLALLGLPGAANAAGSNRPWEAPLEALLVSFQGPVARLIAVILTNVPRSPFPFAHPPCVFLRLFPYCKHMA